MAAEPRNDEHDDAVPDAAPLSSLPPVCVFEPELISILREGSRDTERVLADVERRANRHLVDNVAALGDITPRWVYVAARVAHLLVAVCRQRLPTTTTPSDSSLVRAIKDLAFISPFFARVFLTDTAIGRTLVGGGLVHVDDPGTVCPVGAVEFIRGYCMLLVFRVEEARAVFEETLKLLQTAPANRLDADLQEAVELGLLSAVGKSDAIAAHQPTFFEEYITRFKPNGESSVIRRALVAKIYDVRLGQKDDALTLLRDIPADLMTDQWRVRFVRVRNRRVRDRPHHESPSGLLADLPDCDRLSVEGRRLQAEILFDKRDVDRAMSAFDALIRHVRSFPPPCSSFIQFRKAVKMSQARLHRVHDPTSMIIDLAEAASKNLDRYFDEVVETVQLDTLLSTSLHKYLFELHRRSQGGGGGTSRLSGSCIRYGWAVLRAKRGPLINAQIAKFMEKELEHRIERSPNSSAAKRDMLEFRILAAWPDVRDIQSCLDEFFPVASPVDLVCVLLRLGSDELPDTVVNAIKDAQRKEEATKELALRRRALDTCWVDKWRSGERLLLVLTVNIPLSTLSSEGIPAGTGTVFTGTVESVLTRAAKAVEDPPGQCHYLVGIDPVHWDVKMAPPTDQDPTAPFSILSSHARPIKCTFDLDRLVAKDGMPHLLAQGDIAKIPLSQRREPMRRGRLPR
jgi:hypothetical protein